MEAEVHSRHALDRSRLWTVLPRLAKASRSAQLLGLIIVLGIAARLYNIDGPFVDWHQYRQFDTAAIARNLAENSLNLFYPQVDWRGDSPGYVEVEFQAFTFMVAALYRVFGPHEWLARVLNLFFYAATAILLYRLTREVFGRRAALLAAGLYSFLPLSYSVSRSFQPDTLMMLCTLAGIYYFWRWTEEGLLRWLTVSLAGMAVAVMIKPFCLYLAVPLVYLCWRRFGWRFVIRPVLWFYAALVILPAIAWYVHAFHLWTVYGNTFGIFGGRIRGAYLGADTPGAALLLRTLGWRLLWEIATPPGLVLLAAGFFVRPRSGNYVFHWWTLAFLATVPLVPAGHYGHNYYQLPLVLTAAPAMAYGLVRLVDLGTFSWKGAALMCVAVLACCAWALRPMIVTSQELRERIVFGKHVTRAVPDDALVVFSYPLDYKPSWYSHRTLDGDLIAGDPTDFYNSHRRGFSLLASQTSPEMLQKLEKHHAQYFATFYPKYLYQQQPEIKGYLETHAQPVEVTGRWIIYHLPEPGAPSASLGGN